MQLRSDVASQVVFGRKIVAVSVRHRISEQLLVFLNGDHRAEAGATQYACVSKLDLVNFSDSFDL